MSSRYFMQLLEIRTMLSSVTVVTHGADPWGFGGPLTALGTSIYDQKLRAGQSAALFIYSPGPGTLTKTAGAVGATEKVIVFDWAAESDEFDAGFDEAAGDALFAMLVAYGLLNSNYLHLIGHSRGAIVSSKAAQRIEYHGFQVDQLTLLDAEEGPGMYGAAGKAIAWAGIGFVDNYFGFGSIYAGVQLRGEPIEGAHNRNVAADHGGVLTWYQESVSSISGEFSTEGYVFATSPVLRSYASIDGVSPAVLAPPTVFNGDFTFGTLSEFAGWSHHGGGGTGHIDGVAKYLELDSGGSNYVRRHNRMVVPANATHIFFDYWISNNDVFGPNDVLKVYLGGTAVGDPISLATETSGFIRNASVSLVAQNTPYVSTLTFEIQGGADGVDSEVRIDNIRIVSSPPVDTTSPTASLYFPPDGKPVSQALINSTTPAKYIDITFSDNTGLSSLSILDAAAEFTLSGTAANGVTFDGTPFLQSGNRYRYTFTGNFGLGQVTLNFPAGAFTDNAAIPNPNIPFSRSFTVVSGPTTPTVGPEISVFVSGTPVNSGQATAIDFGTIAVGEPGAARTVTVRNDGDQTLTLGTFSVPDGFRILDQPSSTLPPGREVYFDLVMNSTSAGAKSGNFSFSTNDSNENPFTFKVAGIVGQPQPTATPDISLSYDPGGGGATSRVGVSSGQSISFGPLLTGSTLNVPFNLRNNGTETLTISSITVTGGFSISVLPASVLAGGEANFDLRFSPSEAGYFAGDVTFISNDPDENPFSFRVTAEVISLPPPPTPTLWIDDVTQYEGDDGEIRFNFPLTLSEGTTPLKTVDYVIEIATSNNPATPGVDYREIAGRVYFQLGSERTAVIPVPVKGDFGVEPAESFVVRLINPVGLTLGRDAAVGTILDDDLNPRADIFDVWPKPRNASVGSIKIVFTRPVTGFDLSDLALTRDGGANLLTPAHSLATPDGGKTWTLGNLDGVTAAIGAYTLSLRKDGSGIVDAEGHGLLLDVQDSWVKANLLPSSFSLTDLGDLDGGTTYSKAFAINERGDVVGYSLASGGSRAFLWAPETGMRDLGTLGGPNSAARDINDSGVIVGGADGADGRVRAAWWSGGGAQELGNLGGIGSELFAINNAGHMAGSWRVSTAENDTRGLFFDGTTLRDVGALTGNNGAVFDLNESDFAVGSYRVSQTGEDRVFTFTGAGQPADFGAFPSFFGSIPAGVNNLGWITGAVPDRFGWVYDGRNWQNFGGPGSIVNAVNDLGWAVGQINGLAFAWPGTSTSSQPFVLKNYVDASATGWTLQSAEDINEAGQIVGWGTFNGTTRAFLLNPERVAPVATFSSFSRDPRRSAIEAVTITFTEPVQGLEIRDLVLTRDGGPNFLTDIQTLSTSDGRTWILGNLADVTAIPSDYRLTLAGAGSGVVDSGGNALAGTATSGFVVTTDSVFDDPRFGQPGIERWNFLTGGNVASSPAVGADGTIYVGSRDRRLYALRPDGTVRWSFDAQAELTSSPAIAPDGTIYIGSETDKVFAVSPQGQLKWAFQVGGAGVFSSPSVATDCTIYVGSSFGSLYAINPDGTERWRFAADGVINTSPAIGPDGTIYFGTHGGTFYALRDDGSLKWSYRTGNLIEASPALAADGTVYFGGRDNKLYALRGDGTLKWTFDAADWVTSSPAIGFDGTIYFGSFDSNFYAVNPDGSEKWRFTVPNIGPIRSSPAVAADGTIYVGANDSRLYAIRPGGTKRWEFRTTNDVLSSPSIGPDGTIYFGSLDGRLYAVSGSAQLGDTPWPKFRGNPRNIGQRIDNVPPIANAPSYLLGGPAAKLSVRFSENVQGTLDPSDLRVQLIAGGPSYQAVSVTYDPLTNTAMFLFDVLPDGNYRATLAAAGVMDAAQNGLAWETGFDFFVLNADANRDRTVNFFDLTALSASYGQSGKTWADGDFNGDGSVNFFDLTALAANYSVTLPAPAAVPSESLPTTVEIAPVAASTAEVETDFAVDASADPVVVNQSAGGAAPATVDRTTAVTAVLVTGPLASTLAVAKSGSPPNTSTTASAQGSKQAIPTSRTPALSVSPAPAIVPTKREKPKVKAIFAVAPTIKPVSRPKIAPRRAGH